ncbi:sulfurtransferase TusA family protein [Rhizobiaceae bacterium BDR2-2]|uniref:Sulfurtransferase TusA family protein n=1 Tax=Ectorhizobium quercum TaxID=2965071 RepID=A0AAE3N3M6_9HYPH|nr:sulfurtransferase TusA family protein [Ectorhizobium quercum]MCX8999994.1 sulfurtransferase TusA family protein [Ectorhizobium quercum]
MSANEETIYLLDMKGLRCPIPVARTRKAVRKLPSGTQIRVECTDPLADIDIPHMVNTDGHQLLDKGAIDGVRWYLIRLS